MAVLSVAVWRSVGASEAAGAKVAVRVPASYVTVPATEPTASIRPKLAPLSVVGLIGSLKVADSGL